MDYEKFHQAVVLAYINHDGDPIRFFDEVVSALNQFREENQAAQSSGQADDLLQEFEEWWHDLIADDVVLHTKKSIAEHAYLAGCNRRR